MDASPVATFGAEKARALLAFLAIESTSPHRRAELSAMFWPDLPEKKAAHNLSQTLLRLRQALGEKKDSPQPGFLLITPQDVQFNICSDFQLDVARFGELLNMAARHTHPEAARCAVCHQWLLEAAGLFRGDLLTGLFVPDSLAFEEWRLVQQEQLHRQALETLGRLAAYFEQRAEFKRVQEFARRQVALEPWHEEAHVQLIRAFAQNGQTTAALRQYEIYRQTLVEELGIKPSAQVSALYQQIRQGEGAQPGEMCGNDAAQLGTATWLSTLGERRQVSTLICSRGERADPEEIGEQMAVCERYCEGIYNRFGGRRAARQGNACLVYFGYPQAFEDAARRAVHSALEVSKAVESGEPVRIGIHTGLITVGEQRGHRWQDRDLVGTAPEMARDCQRMAKPGEVLITEDTRRLVQDAFDLQALEACASSSAGAGQPVPIYRVNGESAAQHRLEWLAQTQRLTEFIGRENELAQLQSWYAKIFQGKGQVVLLNGEPGIGKSRLIWELKQRVPVIGASGAQQSHPPVTWLAGRCLPYYQNTGLYPVIGLLEGLLGFQAGDGIKLRQEKLVGTLARYGLDRPASIWLLSLLLGLPGEAPAPEIITKAQRDQMRHLFLVLVQKCAVEQPLILVIEDLHWSDPSTLEWLSYSFDSLSAVPCLVLLTARTGFNSAWLHDKALRNNLLVFSLRPLDSQKSEQMVSDLAGENVLDEVIRRQIVKQTDGIPLFIEELTKTLLERPADDHESSTPAGVLTGIPATLLDSLAARLDHLGAAKETAQWAAALGREFSYPVLQACAPYDETRLNSDLARLIEAELLTPVKAGAQDAAPYLSNGSKESMPAQALTRYAFKHALVQDVAYASMLKRTRQFYHRRIAETLETRFPKLAEIRPEVLAQHYASASMPTQAVDLWLRAGERATMQGATLEARIFLDRALAQAQTCPEPSERSMLAARCQLAFGKLDRLEAARSQALVNAIINSTLDMIWSVDSEQFGLLTWNQSLQEYFRAGRGITLEAGARPEDLFPAGSEYIKIWREYYQRTLAGGPFTVEYQVFTHNRVLQLSFNLLKQDGQVFGISVFGKDITALKETEDKFSKAFLFNPVPMIIRDLTDQNRVVDINQAYEQVTGYTRQEVVGLTRDQFELFVFPAQSDEVYRKIYSGEIVRDLKMTFRKKNGEIILGLVSVVLAEVNGRQHVIASAVDITDRVRAEDALQISEQTARRTTEQLRMVNQMIASLTSGLDFEQLMQKLHEQCQLIGDTDTFYVALYDEATGVVSFPYNYKGGERRIFAARNIRENAGVVGYVIQHRQTLYIPDKLNWPSGIPPAVLQSGKQAQALVSVPLVFDGQVVGVLSMQSYQANAYTAEQIQTLELLAPQAAIAIQNSRFYEQVQNERNLADALIDNLPGVYLLINQQGRLLRWNKYFEITLGYPVEKIGGRDILALITLQDRALFANLIRRCFAGEEEGIETHLITSGGEKELPFYVTGTRVQVGKEIYLSVHAIDITDRKRAEEALK